MFKNYFKTAIRNLWKNKTNSFLNIFGLAIGIACAALIFLWVEDEINFDQFNIKKDRLYFVRVHQKYDAGVLTHWTTPGVMAPVMQAEIPGIANTCRTTEDQTSLLFSVGDKAMYASGKYAEPSIFSMFTLPFLQGNARNAFTQLYSIVVTEKTAKKLFGDAKDVVGKTVRVDNKQDYVVSGVLKDLPENSSLQFEWLAPYEIWFQQSPGAHKWGNSSISTFVEVKPQANVEAINKQLYNFIQQREPTTISHPFLFSIKDWHLRYLFDNGKQINGGGIQYVRMFSLVAWIILFIACINFMNLSTARSEKRAREVGVRKVLGAEKKSLILQFIGEALFLTTLSAIVAVVLVFLVLPSFNTLVQKNLSPGLDKPLHISALLSITVICALVAGSYPSFYLSSFNPVFILKGIKSKAGSAVFIRKGLVVLQFTISIVLIIGTIIIYQQIQHVKSRDLGFAKDNLIELKVQGNMAKNFAGIKDDLINTGMVSNAALTSRGSIYGGDNSDGFTWQGKDPNIKILISQREVTPEFVATVGHKLMAGRDFQQTDVAVVEVGKPPVGITINVLITESLAKLMGKESAIGKTILMPGGKGEYISANVVGVVKDYVYGNMYGKPDPVVFFCLPQFASIMYVRIKPQQKVEQALASIEAVIKKDNPGYPFEYKFVDDQFNQMFIIETLMSRLSRVFAALAIIISCLGLFGLASYTAERRTKEISIRKVLGATARGLASLLSKDFVKLVIIACIIAFPIAWWMMNTWLQGYAYRINISWGVFVAAGLLALLIALMTVSFQAIRTALANPVKSLRTE